MKNHQLILTFMLLFAGYGRLRSLLLKRGYGFVEFEDSMDAIDAVDGLNGTYMMGFKVLVEHAMPRQFRRYSTFVRGRSRGGRGSFSGYRGRGGYSYYTRQMKRGNGFRLLVKNLSSSVSWQDLKDFMGKAGEVAYADVCGPLNEGTVEYRFYADLCRALDTLNNAELGGWKIKLIEEVKSSNKKYRYRDDRSETRSRTTSKSSSRSKSRSPVKSK